MTDDQDRALWVQVKTDYEHARKLAFKIWGDDLANDPAACNAITATLLIHHKDLGKQERVHVRVPAQAAVSSDAPNTSHAPAAGIPECPSCGGPMEDKRESKRSDKAPDFVCLQAVRPCGKPSKDGKYFNKTGKWIEPANVTPKPKAQGAVVGVAAGRNFNSMPDTLTPEDDELPF